MRREILIELERVRAERRPRETVAIKPNSIPCPEERLDFHGNVLNRHAEEFFARHGTEVVEPAFETFDNATGREVMKTKYCLRYQLDACLRDEGAVRKLKAPLRLYDKLHSYRLEFDCDHCLMTVILE